MWNRFPNPRDAKRGVKERKPRRIIPLFIVSMLAYLAQVIGGDARFYFDRIERLPAVSDHRTLRLLEPYVAALASTKPFQMKHPTTPFILLLPHHSDCRLAPS